MSGSEDTPAQPLAVVLLSVVYFLAVLSLLLKYLKY
jgi:hypothetical protein